MGITIANNSIVSGSWGSVNKAQLGQKLAEAGDAKAIREAYLIVGDIKKRKYMEIPPPLLIRGYS